MSLAPEYGTKGVHHHIWSKNVFFFIRFPWQKERLIETEAGETETQLGGTVLAYLAHSLVLQKGQAGRKTGTRKKSSVLSLKN